MKTGHIPHVKDRRQILALLGAGLLATAGCVSTAETVVPHRYIGEIPVNTVERATLIDFRVALAEILAGTPATTGFGKSFAVATLPETVLFDHPQTDIRAASMPLVTQIAALMQRYPSVSVEIMSHWDLSEVAVNSMVKSERRGVAIQSALMSRGVAINRLVVSGLGEAYPIATNASAIGKSINRRVDLIFRARH